MPRLSRLSVIEAILVLVTIPSVLTAQAGQSTLTPPTLRQANAPHIAPGATPATDPDGVRPAGRYQLRSGDVLDLNFPFVPDFNQTITVQPDGFITLRALGTLRVESMTVPELAERLRTEYGTILRDPVVTVELKEFEKPYVVVAGEVERPGKYELRGETTATQALAVAGGLKDRARSSEAVIFRRLPEGGFESRPLDLKTILKEGRLNADLPLRAGDTLFVPRGRGGVNWSTVSAVVSSLWVLTYLLR
jgi:polysaccharide export outer membrane protein